MKPYLAAALQMTSVPNLGENLAQAEELIDLATRRGAELITLPRKFFPFWVMKKPNLAAQKRSLWPAVKIIYKTTGAQANYASSLVGTERCVVHHGPRIPIAPAHYNRALTRAGPKAKHSGNTHKVRTYLMVELMYADGPVSYERVQFRATLTRVPGQRAT